MQKYEYMIHLKKQRFNINLILIDYRPAAEKHAEVPCVTASVDDLHIEHSVRLVSYIILISDKS